MAEALDELQRRVGELASRSGLVRESVWPAAAVFLDGGNGFQHLMVCACFDGATELATKMTVGWRLQNVDNDDNVNDHGKNHKVIITVNKNGAV